MNLKKIVLRMLKARKITQSLEFVARSNCLRSESSSSQSANIIVGRPHKISRTDRHEHEKF